MTLYIKLHDHEAVNRGPIGWVVDDNTVVGMNHYMHGIWQDVVVLRSIACT